MKELCRILFGSHMYGTSTPASDLDYKGVFLPTKREIFLGKIPRNINESTGDSFTKNTSDDVDIELFGLHEFIKLALQGQTIAFDMLHAPKFLYVGESDPIWSLMLLYKDKFYSKNVHAFIGYACGQAAKYSVKGARLTECENVITFLEKLPMKSKLMENDLTGFPTGEFIKFIPKEDITNKHPDQPKFDTYEVCSKQFQVTVTVEYARDIVKSYFDRYGDRAKKAAQDGAVDWKAMSHAFRVAYEAKELFERHTITFPRPEKDFLLQIKTGQLKMSDLVFQLDDLIDEVKSLRDSSTLPEKPDHKFWEDFTYDVISNYVKKEL